MPYVNPEQKKAADRLYYLSKRKGVEDNQAIYQSQKSRDPDFLARRREIQARSRARKKAKDPEGYAASMRAQYYKRKLLNPEGAARNSYDSGKRRLSTPQGRIANNMRSRIVQCFKVKSVSKSLREAIGCDWITLASYIESLWLPGMSWENYTHDGWHIDHIQPVSSFEQEDPAQFAKCWHYTNFQPLWAKDNMRKGNRVA